MDETTNQVSVTITANGDGTFIVEQNDQENPQENMEEGGVEEQKAFKSLDEALNKVRELLMAMVLLSLNKTTKRIRKKIWRKAVLKNKEPSSLWTKP
jgi:hypothetical protein